MLNKHKITKIDDLKNFDVDKLEGYQNIGQEDQRNFISVRVFPNKFKDDILHHTL